MTGEQSTLGIALFELTCEHKRMQASTDRLQLCGQAQLAVLAIAASSQCVVDLHQE